MIIHLCVYASQPDILIYCTDAWTTPAWPDAIRKAEAEGILPLEEERYLADNGQVYTFEERHVTCPDCLAQRAAQKG